MKNTAIKSLLKTTWALFLLLIISGCGEMLDDPTVDKDTGDDIQLLIVDFNFFTTRMDFKLIDAESNLPLTKTAKIWFSGKNANDIVNFAGEKNSEYTTSAGQMELTIDPNIAISGASPFEYAVNVEIDGYKTLTQGIQINAIGKKTFELLLEKENSGDETTLTGEEDGDSFTFSILPQSKSANVENESHKISFSIKKSDILLFKDIYGKLIFANEAEMMDAYYSDKENFLVLNYIPDEITKPFSTERITVEGRSYMAIVRTLESGVLKNLAVAHRMVSDLNGGKITQLATSLSTPEPDVFGFAVASENGKLIVGTSIQHVKLNSPYTLISASLDELCATGASITFQSNAISSFIITADFYNDEEILITSKTFKGKFPETFVLENVPEQAAFVVFRNNNASFKPIEPLEISNLCSGSYSVDVNPSEGFNEYQVTLLATCSNNSSIAVAPTYSGQYRINKEGQVWQGLDMIGGVVDILAKPNEDYQFRILWEDEWETFDFGTHFNEDGSYRKTTTTREKVSAENMEDGRIRLKVEHEFKQSICDDMDW